MSENNKKRIEIYEVLQSFNSPVMGGGLLENVPGDKIVIMEPEEVWIADPSNSGEYYKPTYSAMFVRINEKLFARIG